MKRLFRGWSWEHWYNLAREDIEAAYDSVRRAVRVVVYAGVAVWVLSGFHAIRPDEVGIETVCGAVLRSVEQPGLRYRLPWPVGAVQRVPMQRQQRVTVGLADGGLTADQRLGKAATKALDTTVADRFDQDVDTKGSKLDEVIKEGQKKQLSEGARIQLGDGLSLLTADHNVIQVQAVVQYTIRDPRQWLYATEGADLVIRRAATSALLQEATATGVDQLLTTARVQTQERVKREVNAALRPFALGVDVAGVELQRVAPPTAVEPSFRSVNSAREEKNTAVNEADQYRGTIVPEASGTASRMVSEAEAFRSTRLAEASGEASRFNGVLREYRASGPLTGERLRLETVERALAKASRVQVGSGLDVVMTTPPPGQGP
ncbi:MAG: FtsH protease activity modulator HflK [Fimbriimonadaceae bacterium]|nr:FtsH protease activity modulator HflK [Fimbriimonadaceae bacterium]